MTQLPPLWVPDPTNRIRHVIQIRNKGFYELKYLSLICTNNPLTKLLTPKYSRAIKTWLSHSRPIMPRLRGITAPKTPDHKKRRACKTQPPPSCQVTLSGCWWACGTCGLLLQNAFRQTPIKLLEPELSPYLGFIALFVRLVAGSMLFGFWCHSVKALNMSASRLISFAPAWPF